MQLKLLVKKQVPDKNGKLKMRHPGDWVEIKNKKMALLWIANGEAVAFGAELASILPANSGIVLVGSAPEPLKQQILSSFSTLNIKVGEPSLPFSRTIIWNTRTPIRHALFGVGLTRLENWQVSIPLRDHQEIALHHGTEEDRARTLEVIHDLRVPVYETDIMFVRRSDTTRALIDLWVEECKHGNERLAWLRAVYQIKPHIEALPMSWLNEGALNG